MHIVMSLRKVVQVPLQRVLDGGVTHGQALNITCYSYAGTLSFGFSACRDSLPRVQRLAVYTGEALEELEEALLKPRNSNIKTKAKATVAAE